MDEDEFEEYEVEDGSWPEFPSVWTAVEWAALTLGGWGALVSGSAQHLAAIACRMSEQGSEDRKTRRLTQLNIETLMRGDV